MISYIGLGSNLYEPLAQLQKALKTIQNHPQMTLLKCSGFYQSKALTVEGAAPQDDYINAVAMLDTTLTVEQLLVQLNKIEVDQGRERKEKWGARTLDLDILLYDELQMQTDKLIIPHAQIRFRNFVIHPLFEVAGPIKIPGLGELARLAEQTNWDGLQRVNESH